MSRLPQFEQRYAACRRGRFVDQALQIRILLAAGRWCGRAYGRAIEMHRIARRNFTPLLVAMAADRMC